MENFFNHAKNLRTLRKYLGLTQQDLAFSSQEKQGRIRDIEAGKQKIPVTLAIKMEKIHHVNFKWLLTGEGHMFENENCINSNQTTSNYDTNDLKNVIIEVEKYIKNTDIIIPPEKKADIIIFLYQLYTNNNHNITDNIIVPVTLLNNFY